MEIEQYPNYLIYDDGRVYSKKSKKFLKHRTTCNGYTQVVLYREGKHKIYKIHRLVALAYIPNPCNLPTVDHIDRDKTNNHVSNLRWACRSLQSVNKNHIPSNTGHKNIHIKTDKRRNNTQIYYIQFERNRLCYVKSFKIETPIQTVIDFRDMMLSMFDF